MSPKACCIRPNGCPLSTPSRRSAGRLSAPADLHATIYPRVPLRQGTGEEAEDGGARGGLARTVGGAAVADDGDAATLDADRRQGAVVADALAEPRLARDAAGLGAGAYDGSDPPRRGRILDGVRLHRRGSGHPRQRRRRAPDRAEVRDGGRLLRRGSGRPDLARRGLSHRPDARRNGRVDAVSAG